MRKLFSTLLLLLVATNAAAFSAQTEELLSTIAMPLAVAAVSQVTGVQQAQLSSLVSTLRRCSSRTTTSRRRFSRTTAATASRAIPSP